MKSVDTIVVAGGKSSRMYFIDKSLLPLQRQSLLEIAIENGVGEIFLSSNSAGIAHKNVVVVKDLVPTGGPAVGVWSCLQQMKSDFVLLLAADQPFIGKFIRPLIDLALNNSNGAWIKVDGYFQPFASCVKRELLFVALKQSQGVNISMRGLLEGMNLAKLEINDNKIWDIDTWSDYFYALGQINERPDMTEDWIETLKKQLNIKTDFLDTEEILKITRAVAHNIERKAAPLTTFLLGYLAGQKNLRKEQISEIIKEVEKTINQIKEKSGDK
jgi:molybdopterin-guanine dinucleotide biosynthesis protein A